MIGDIHGNEVVHITLDHGQNLTDTVGKLIGVTPQGKNLIGMFKQGYGFEITPILNDVEYSEDGKTIENATLVGLSLNTISGKKVITMPGESVAHAVDGHKPECNWIKKREACEYGASHHYCPHAEHACDCKG